VAYCGAKYAIRGFTDSLRTELLESGSRHHSLAASFVDTSGSIEEIIATASSRTGCGSDDKGPRESSREPLVVANRPED
jgi:NAD(P)-dependent dehydrogenase (short-subunit alcohol dehydrogenase family)